MLLDGRALHNQAAGKRPLSKVTPQVSSWKISCLLAHWASDYNSEVSTYSSAPVVYNNVLKRTRYL